VGMPCCPIEEHRQTSAAKVFNDSTKWLALLYVPSLPSKLKPPDESAAPRTDDFVVLFPLVRT